MIGFLNSLANLLELVKSFAVNQVLRDSGYNFDACKEQAMALLLENNFCLKEIMIYKEKM